MRSTEKIKSIRWLLVAAVGLVIYPLYSLNKLEGVIYRQELFEHALMNEMFFEGLALRNILMHKDTEIDEKVVLDEEFLKNILSEYTYMEPEVEIPKTLHKVESTWWFGVSVHKNIYFQHGILYDVNNSIQDNGGLLHDVEYNDVELVLTGRYISDFMLIGVCDIVIGGLLEENRVVCDKERTLIVAKDRDEYIWDIDHREFKNKLDLKVEFDNIVKLADQTIDIPVVNAKVNFIHLGFSFVLISYFIQIYSLVNIRSVSIFKESDVDWLFVSWLRNSNINVADNISTFIEGAAGISSYFSLCFFPVFTVWQSLQIQRIANKIGNELFYIQFVPSVLFSALVFWYLVTFMVYCIKDTANKKRGQEKNGTRDT